MKNRTNSKMKLAKGLNGKEMVDGVEVHPEAYKFFRYKAKTKYAEAQILVWNGRNKPAPVAVFDHVIGLSLSIDKAHAKLQKRIATPKDMYKKDFLVFADRSPEETKAWAKDQINAAKVLLSEPDGIDQEILDNAQYTVDHKEEYIKGICNAEPMGHLYHNNWVTKADQVDGLN